MSDQPTTWLTPKSAARRAQVTVVTLRRAVKAGALRAFRINGGRCVRFRAADVDAWLSAAPVKAVRP